ncbi:type I restriction modification DNA specificity domain-containing protein [Campylobacter jejuni subsp. doylei]|nr:type I restriction modification DNA specificity domain-containing protein [Campylobacter jejuni subsp. doylei]
MLGEVCEIYDGTHRTPKYTTSGIKFVSVENINNLYASNKFITQEAYKEYVNKKAEIGDILMTRIGSIGECAVITTNEDLAYYVSLALLKPNKNKVLGGFLKHYIESAGGKRELGFKIIHSAVPIKINKGNIGKIQIPIPPLETQIKIVSILDKFHALTTDLTSGIPAEIEARKKQYEYYRNQLLTFKEAI